MIVGQIGVCGLCQLLDCVRLVETLADSCLCPDERSGVERPLESQPVAALRLAEVFRKCCAGGRRGAMGLEGYRAFSGFLAMIEIRAAQ